MATTQIVMPSGANIWAPQAPRSWTEKALAVYGDALSAKLLESSVAINVAYHRMRPLFQGEQTVATLVSPSSNIALALAELVDNVQGHSDSANVNRWYAPSTNTSGGSGDWYLATGYACFSSSDPTKSFNAGLRVTNAGGATTYEGGKHAGATGHPVSALAVDLVQMTGGDYLELIARQDTAAGINTNIATRTSTLTVRWVCAQSGTVVALPSTPRTWTSTDLLTADATGGANVPLNLNIRDVIRWLNYPAIARITSQSSSQTIPTGTGTWTSIQMPTASVDNHTMWSSGANTKLTCTKPGLYFVYGLASTVESATATGYRASRILQTKALGGTQIYGGETVPVATASSGGTQLVAPAMIRLAVNDTIELQMQHTEASSLTVATSTNSCSRLIAVWERL